MFPWIKCNSSFRVVEYDARWEDEQQNLLQEYKILLGRKSRWTGAPSALLQLFLHSSLQKLWHWGTGTQITALGEMGHLWPKPERFSVHKSSFFSSTHAPLNLPKHINRLTGFKDTVTLFVHFYQSELRLWWWDWKLKQFNEIIKIWWHLD